MGLKLRVLYLGKMEFPRFRLVECDNEATMVVSPAVALLIQHPTLGNILYDTGNSADFLKTYTPEMLHNYPITEMITIEEALAKEGLTMLVVTHEMGFARNVSSKTVFMENGVVVEQAPSHEFFANPKEERTREFLRKIAHTE